MSSRCNIINISMLFLFHFVIVYSELKQGTNLCKICDRSTPKPLNSSKSKNKCFRYGTYDVFCHPDLLAINRKENFKINECESFFSINLPHSPNTKCDINIYDNHGIIQDIITVSDDGNFISTNNTWYVKPQEKSGSLNFGIAKRIKSRKYFEGRK